MTRPVHPVPSGTSRGALWIVALLAAHVPLALAMRSYPALSTVHALASVALGLLWAVTGRPDRVAAVGAYLAGSEVLWRMTGAGFFWEGAKYATVLIFGVALLRAGRLKAPLPAIAYFALLVPSTALTWMDLGFAASRSVISFNLSGPLALAASVWFFFHLRVSREGMARILCAMLAPILGVLAVSYFGTVTAADLAFGGGSNFITSGGFGPNQVSAVLGLGALLAFILAFDHTRPAWFRAGMLGVFLALAAQSALTFSRTGVAAMAICVVAGLFYFIRDRRLRANLAVTLPVLAGAALLVVVPRLESLTHGAIADRFTNTSPTGRDQLAKADLLIFLDHPLLGVGPGQAKSLREVTGRVGVAHTEFTRMLAEHGIPGLVALILLFGMAISRFRVASGPREKALVAMLLGWSLLFMLVGGMRIVAPSFIFGLACALPARARRVQRARSLVAAPTEAPLERVAAPRAVPFPAR